MFRDTDLSAGELSKGPKNYRVSYRGVGRGRLTMASAGKTKPDNRRHLSHLRANQTQLRHALLHREKHRN